MSVQHCDGIPVGSDSVCSLVRCCDHSSAVAFLIFDQLNRGEMFQIKRQFFVL